MDLRQSILALSACLLCVAGSGTAWAQIFSCVDGNGRKITSDRPIAECRDKDQKELNSNATVKRIIKPTMTAQEQAASDQKLKDEAVEKAYQEENRRRNRALLSRYPNKAAHDKERVTAQAQVDEIIKTAQSRIGELSIQRKKLDEEMEFYKKDPAKAPAALRRQMDENEKNVSAQRRFIGEQGEEKKRLDSRYDEELERLRSLWAQAAMPTAAASAPLKK
jgi:Domain of unknown function (DUF4124)